MNDDRLASTGTLPQSELPDFPSPTAEEIERRRKIFARVGERRDRIGPIGVSVDDLIHELRGGADRFDP